jgi:MFS family permease
MGISALASQALSAPPYLVSFLVVLLTAFLSDRYANRSKFVIFHAVFGGCGYAMIAIAGYYEAGVWWRYAGVYPASAGFFSAITIIITWTINNQDSDSKRGTGVALLNAIGQLGPLLGTRLYPEIDRPYYVRGMSVCAGFMFFVGILALLLRTILMRENKRRCLEEEKGGGEREPFVDRGVRRPKPFMNML